MDFTFNGVSSTTHGIRVKNVTRNILPPTKTNLLDIPNKAGAYFINNIHEARIISVEIQLIKATSNDLRTTIRNIANWLKTDVVKPLFFSDEPTLNYDAILTGQTDIEQLLFTGQGSIEFICPNPYAYEVAVNVPLSLGNTSHTVTGTAFTTPIFTFNFTSTATDLKITFGSKYVRLIDAIPNFATVVIDCDKKLVTVNGVNRMVAVDLNSEFFDLTVGNNTINLTSTGSCTGTMNYKPRWF